MPQVNDKVLRFKVIGNSANIVYAVPLDDLISDVLTADNLLEHLKADEPITLTKSASGTYLTIGFNDEALKGLSADIAAAKTEVTAGDNIEVIESKAEDGHTIYKISGLSVPDAVDIVSSDNTVNITTSVDAATNTKTFDLSVKGGAEYTVAHDGTMTGEGTAVKPLSIQSALDVSNANTAPKYDSNLIYPTVGTLCTYNNVLYRSKVNINEAEEWNEEHWEVDSVASELKAIKADPTWVKISSKLGNYDGTNTGANGRNIFIYYSRKLALILFAGFVSPNTGGNNVKLFSFNTDIVPFNTGEYFTKSGDYVIYVSLTPYNVVTEFRKPYSITARNVTTDQNIEFQFICPLTISTDEFDAYLASH